MDEFRAAQAERLAAEFSNLVEDGRGAATLFLDLVCDTFASLPEGSLHKRIPFKADATSGFNLACWDGNPALLALPTALQARWIAWRGVWQTLKDSNPRLELADMFVAISETHDGSSWPSGMEDRIEDWATGGADIVRPFEDHPGLATQAFRARLCALRGIVGG